MRLHPAFLAAACLSAPFAAVPRPAPAQTAAPAPPAANAPAAENPVVARVDGEEVRMADVASVAAEVLPPELRNVPPAALMQMLPPEVSRTLAGNALWRALPAVRENRVAVLDPINHFGGLPSAHRFATLLERAWLGSARG